MVAFGHFKQPDQQWPSHLQNVPVAPTAQPCGIQTINGRGFHTHRKLKQIKPDPRAMEAQDRKILAQAQRTTAVIGLARVIDMHGKEIEAGLATAMSGRANAIGIGIGMGGNVIHTRMDGG